MTSGNNTTTQKTNGIGQHFTILKKSNNSVSPLMMPLSPVIDFETLDQALHPNGTNIFGVNNGTSETIGQSESRATTPSFGRREPNEISFLSNFDKLRISHNCKDECLTCCQTLEFLSPEDVVVMRATKRRACSHQNFEIFHLITRELVLLIEVEVGTWSCMVPNSIQVYGPPGKSLGFVDRYSACGSNSYFEIRNAAGEPIYTIEPKFQCFGPTEYSIMSKEDIKSKVAKIEVLSSGCFYCGFKISVKFIENLTPSKRALVIGFALLVDLIEMQKHPVPI